MNKEEFDDVEEIFDFPDELDEEDLNDQIANKEEITEELVQSVEPIYEETVQSVEPVYEEAVQPVEPVYEEAVQPVEPVYEEAAQPVEPVYNQIDYTQNNMINENPNAQVSLKQNDYEEEQKADNSEIPNVKLLENKSLMFVLAIGIVIFVAIFVLPYLLY